MKIKKITIENINSLYGTWTIDLTTPEFSDGVFAIIGETGSGKTTIFDAVCLALYGTTPRINDKIGVTLADVVSRSAGRQAAASASVVCEHDGHIYESSFKLHLNRAGNDLTGQNGQIGTLVRDGVFFRKWTAGSKMRKDMEEILGRTFEQFTRTVLLAQGEFSKFLDAEEKEQTAILQKITGTGIYAELCGRIRREKDVHCLKYETACREYDLISENMMSAENAAALEKRQQELKDDIQKKQEALKGCEGVLQALHGAERIRQTLDSQCADEKKAIQDQQDFVPQQERLRKADKARAVRDCIVANDDLRRQHAKNSADLKRCESDIAANCEALKKARNEADEAKQAKDITHEKNRVRLEDIIKAEKLDVEISGAERHCIEVDAALKKIRGNFESRQKELQDVRQEISRLAEADRECADYLAAHAADSELERLLPAWEARIRQLGMHRREYISCRKQVSDGQKEVASAEKQLAYCRDLEVQAQAEREKHAADLEELKKRREEFCRQYTEDELERQVKKSRMAADSARLAVSDNVCEMRSRLADGHACPLCGSLEHPYAMGNIPSVSAEEAEEKKYLALQRAFNALKTNVELAEQRVKSASSTLENCGENRKNAAAAFEKCRNALKNAEKKLDEAQKSFAEEFRGLQDSFAAFGVTVSEEITTLPRDIVDRAAKYAEAAAQHNEYSANQTKLKNVEVAANTACDTIKPNLDNAENEMNKHSEALAALRASREEILGTASTVELRAQIDGENNAAVVRQQNSEKKVSSLQAQSVILEKQQKEYSAENDRLTEALAGSANEVAAKLALHAITVEDYRAWIIEDSEYDTLLQRRTTLETTLKNLAAAIEKSRTDYMQAMAKVPEGCSGQEMQDRKQKLEQEIASANQELGRNRESLENYERDLNNCGEQKRSIEDLKRTADYWELFYNNFAKGDKLADFAQKITLDRLLFAANAYLKDLNGRYALYREIGAGDQHSIWVIDNFRGGEQRRAGNLSGGEKFLVSLALALGLSKMNSDAGIADSFFLDEGFGSLSGDALSDAIRTLKGLRNGGKLVGVISHVPEIAENIGCRLEVRKQGNGCSLVRGPGITFCPPPVKSRKRK